MEYNGLNSKPDRTWEGKSKIKIVCWLVINRCHCTLVWLTSRVELLVMLRFSRLGNAVNPSTLLSWLLETLSVFTCGIVPSYSIAVSLFLDRSRSCRFGNCCSNSAGMQVKPRSDKLQGQKSTMINAHDFPPFLFSVTF